MVGLCLFLWKYICINDILKHCEINISFLPQTKISLVKKKKYFVIETTTAKRKINTGFSHKISKQKENHE